MPKENKRARGRRDARNDKRKRPEEEDYAHHNKRQRSAGPEVQLMVSDNAETFEDEAQMHDAIERPFFGLLDEEEQEYFRRADELLELNDFPSSEERSLFLANVYKEAEGKELKIANSQSCSRLMERLILLSTPDQKKKLFEKFSGHFLHLVQHRFASHCCEKLFIESAPLVTQELIGDSAEAAKEGQDIGKLGGVYVSMENLFLYTLNELEGHMDFLLTDRFASHALRVLLVILSGQPLAKSSTKSLLQSKKKEKISIAGLIPSSAEFILDRRAVPASFDFAVSKIISDTIIGLDSTFIHVLATHPTGNPSLQLLLELELTRQTKEKLSPETPTIIQKLLPDDIAAPNSKSASFINGLIYDSIGSRLLETIVTFAPGKLFKKIYSTTFKERIGSLARNEVASFVVIRVLERLSKADLEEAVTSIILQIPGLIERSRTTVIKTLLERCQARYAPKSIALLTTTIEESYGSDPKTLLLKMTKTDPKLLALESATEASSKPVHTTPSTIHGSLLAQTMLSIPGPPVALIQTSILALSHEFLLSLACTTSTSHIVQSALAPTLTNLSFRRKLINSYLQDGSGPPSTATQQPAILTLALSKAGSHVLDAMYHSTAQLMNLKERICSILNENIDTLRNDFIGRIVLRVWMVELFGRRKDEWIKKVRKADEQTLVGVRQGGALVGVGAGPQSGRDTIGDRSIARMAKATNLTGVDKVGRNLWTEKTAIERAREKFAEGRKNKALKLRRKATGANAT